MARNEPLTLGVLLRRYCLQAGMTTATLALFQWGCWVLENACAYEFLSLSPRLPQPRGVSITVFIQRQP